MVPVILESPFSAPTLDGVNANIRYARECIRDSLLRNEAPIASHLLYTQEGILDDKIPAERAHGIDAGHAWLKRADKMVVYIDKGISNGMRLAMERARAVGLKVVERSIKDWR